MQVTDDLLDVLLCPESHKPLYYFPDGGDGAGFFFCPDSKRKYRIEQGIPVMLVDDSEVLADADASALEAQAKQRGLRLTGPG